MIKDALDADRIELDFTTTEDIYEKSAVFADEEIAQLEKDIAAGKACQLLDAHRRYWCRNA